MGQQNIVEADHGHIFWDASAGRPESTHRTDGRVVIAREDRIELDPIQQHLLNRGEGFVFIEFTGRDQLGAEGDIVCLQGFTIAALAPDRVFVSLRPL